MSAPRTGIVVQVRLGSTRLPGKALLPLGGASLTDQVLARLALVPGAAHILATDEASGAALAPIAARHGFDLLVGSPEDVLARYCLAIRTFGLQRVLRATGDNPLVSHEAASLLIERGNGAPADYATFTGLPLGMGVELVAASALLRAEAEAMLPNEREHVCPYLYGHPELFSLDRVQGPGEFLMPVARVTVDTASDYEAVKAIYDGLYSGQPIPTRKVLEWLTEHPRARA